MRDIPASDVRTRLFQILNEVERGESVRVTRHGRPVVRIVPEAQRRQAEVDRAIESMKELRKRTGKIPLEQLLSARYGS